MKELVEILNRASDAYYNGEEIMSNFEYDKLYDELVALEESTGITLEDSPTGKAGAEVVDSLPKYKHEYVALSLAKTKDIDEYCKKFQEHICSAEHKNVANRVINNDVVLMWKLDGSTVQLYYNKGKLVHAVTRGNGEVGSIIDHNAPYIQGIPMKIDYKGKLVVRGEALMTYSEFDRINKELPPDDQYKNPRNLANATISLLDSNEMRQRRIIFNAFELVAKEDGLGDDFMDRLNWLDDYGFQTVERCLIHWSMLKKTMKEWEDKVPDLDFPVDGLVTVMNDCFYTKDLPGTGHNPHIMKGYAFKWKDDTAETILREIEWSPSRTGLLNPVAVFDSIELEGTTVSRASVHNVSYIESMDLRIGDKVNIAKMNKIIPQIVENLSKDSINRPAGYAIAKKCPICGSDTVVEQTVGGTKAAVLKCPNPDCAAKHIGQLAHFCERDCMNIIGMSESTIEKLVDCGAVKTYVDFYHLDEHPEIAKIEGLGTKSWKNMIEAANKSKDNYDFVGLIHAMGIPNVGKGQAKLLKKAIEKWCAEFYPDFEMNYVDALSRMSDCYDFESIEGFGGVIASSLTNWLEKNMIKGSVFMDLMIILDDRKVEKVAESTSSIAGKTFVITGTVNHFKNREELKTKIESLGGKVSGSVSSKTNFLINNDVTSTSGKNKKAKELGVKIISEDELLKML